MKYHSIEIKFNWRDFWIGAYIEKQYVGAGCHWQHVYICLVPMLPIKITFYREVTPDEY